MDGFALSEEEGSQINFRGTKMIVKVSGDDSEGRYSLIEMVHPPNIGPALHIHPSAPEAHYVLKGDYIIRAVKRLITLRRAILYSFQKVFHIIISQAQQVEKYLLFHLQDWKNTLRNLLILFRLATLRGN
jgi:uncharacterized cupin superfamily protein